MLPAVLCDRRMDAVKDTFCGFALDLLYKEALALSELEKEKLAESWIPQGAACSSATSLVKGGKAGASFLDRLQKLNKAFLFGEALQAASLSPRLRLF